MKFNQPNQKESSEFPGSPVVRFGAFTVMIWVQLCGGSKILQAVLQGPKIKKFRNKKTTVKTGTEH